MKILYINYEFPPLGGGGGIANFYIAKFLAQNNKVVVITSLFKKLDKFSQIFNINIYRVSVLFRRKKEISSFLSLLFFIPFALFQGYKLLKKNKFDLINAHFVIPSGIIAILLSKIFKIPYIISTHGGDIYDPSKKFSPDKNFILKKITTYLLKNSKKIIVVSSDMKNKINKYYQIFDNIEIIPNSLPMPILKNKIVSRKDLNLDSKTFIIISIGRLIKRKRYDLLLNALSCFENKENFLLLIIGQGPEKEKIEKLKNQLKINVQLLGYLTEQEKFNYLSCSDLFALSSSHEAFGIVFLEAMSAGLPIIAEKTGGQIDFLKNEENGFLVDFTDFKEVCEKISLLFNNDILRKKMGNINKEKVKEYSIEKIGLMYENLYKDILENV